LQSCWAEAFVERGAKVYIGWRQSVLADHTDQATELLLKHLITERKIINQSVTETMTEMGPYPVLAYYPPEARGYFEDGWCDACLELMQEAASDCEFGDVAVRIGWLTMLVIFIGIVATAVLIIEVAILIKRKLKSKSKVFFSNRTPAKQFSALILGNVCSKADRRLE